MAQRVCASCRAGEIEFTEEDGDLTLCSVRNPDDGRCVYLRAWLCDDHLSMYLDDGYTVKEL